MRNEMRMIGEGGRSGSAHQGHVSDHVANDAKSRRSLDAAQTMLGDQLAQVGMR
jgi:hypothetical protein